MAIEAKRLGLIEVYRRNIGTEQARPPIILKGDGLEVIVEPHFSGLVRLPGPTTHLTWRKMGNSGNYGASADFPCDYQGCDWSNGTDAPEILGFMLPPCAYDFQADVETTNRLSWNDSANLAEIASRALELTSAAPNSSDVTESDWQRATQAAHVRFKFVPKKLSNLDVPDLCLIELSDGSRTMLTCSHGQFIKHEVANVESIREINELLEKPVARVENDVKEFLAAAGKAAREQKWEEFLSRMTEDCRDEWMLEIIHECQLAKRRLEGQGDQANQMSAKAIGILNQLERELETFEKPNDRRIVRILEEQFQSYNRLTPERRTKFHVDFMRARYKNLNQLSIRVLECVQKLDETNPVLDLSAISDLKLTSHSAEGTLLKRELVSDANTPSHITMEIVHSDAGHRSWRIGRVARDSIFDGTVTLFPTNPAILGF